MSEANSGLRTLLWVSNQDFEIRATACGHTIGAFLKGSRLLRRKDLSISELERPKCQITIKPRKVIFATQRLDIKSMFERIQPAIHHLEERTLSPKP